MPDYLLDTNHVTHLLGGTETLRQRVEATAATGQKFGIAMTVVGELFYAAYVPAPRASCSRRGRPVQPARSELAAFALSIHLTPSP